MRVKAAKLARLMLFPFSFPLLLLWFFFMPALARDIYGRLNGFATHFKYTKNNNFAVIFTLQSVLCAVKKKTHKNDFYYAFNQNEMKTIMNLSLKPFEFYSNLNGISKVFYIL